jgi:hypothetical protein
MPDIYKKLALSYRALHYRMTTERRDHWDPAAGFSAMQGLNALSLLLLLPLEFIPSWFFVGAPFTIGFLAFWLVSRIYRDSAIPPQYANDLSDNVPAFREFPLAYAYVLATFLLFFSCAFLAMRGAA